MEHTSRWSTTTVMALLPVVILGISMAMMAGLTVVNWFEVGWFMLACTVLVIVLAAPLLAAHLRIDEAGVTTASVAGFPRVHIPASEITGVEVAHVSALGDYWGWGWRSNQVAKGFVLRDGPAVVIHRSAGKAIVFTTPEAGAAAARIGALVPG